MRAVHCAWEAASLPEGRQSRPPDLGNGTTKTVLRACLLFARLPGRRTFELGPRTRF
jgi:hypothetical protein